MMNTDQHGDEKNIQKELDGCLESEKFYAKEGAQKTNCIMGRFAKLSMEVQFLQLRVVKENYQVVFLNVFVFMLIVSVSQRKAFF